MSIDGKKFKIEDIKNKKIFITFYRFASCPFCNLRINEIVKRYNEFGSDFEMVAIFDSPIDNLIKQTKKHKDMLEESSSSGGLSLTHKIWNYFGYCPLV